MAISSEFQLDTIYCGDCAKVMATWPDECIDLTITSPPYDNLRDYDGYTFNFEVIAQQLYRVTKQGGVVVWVVGDATIDGNETGTSFRQALYFKDVCGFNLHDTMIFGKINPAPQIFSKRYRNEFEFMFVFSKGIVSTCNAIKETCQTTRKSKTSFGTKNRGGDVAVNKEYIRLNKDKIMGNIWHYKVGNLSAFWNNSQHPAPFPEALARDHILSWSNPHDIVLDPMIGSGTVAKMCILLDRHFIGIDISEKYCDLSRQRIENASLQPKLISFESPRVSRDNFDIDKLNYQLDLPSVHHQSLETE